MSTCADNEDIDILLEVLKPFIEKELEGRSAGMQGCTECIMHGGGTFYLSSISALTFGYQLTL